MLKKVIAVMGVCIVSGAAAAQDNSVGKQEFMVACAGCHGETGMGDGPVASVLKIDTPNLTKLSSGNGGTFPYEKVRKVIDGRNDVRAHGSAMPVWGDRYFLSASKAGGDVVEANAGLITLGRIQSLVDYLESIQQ